MATSTTVLIDAELHEQARKKLAKSGLSVDDAVRQMLSSVVADCGAPLSLHVPNVETRSAMEELDGGGGLRSASVEELLRELGA